MSWQTMCRPCLRAGLPLSPSPPDGAGASTGSAGGDAGCVPGADAGGDGASFGLHGEHTNEKVVARVQSRT